MRIICGQGSKALVVADVLFDITHRIDSQQIQAKPVLDEHRKQAVAHMMSC
jgi:hypothetical protein